MTIRHRPIIAVTMGDAAGIGPEVIVKALLSKQIFDICRPLVVGEGNTMSEIMRLLDSPVKLHPVEKAGEVKGRFGTIDLLDLHNLDSKEVMVGKVCKICGKAAMEYVIAAAEMALAREVRAIVTAPINKEATIQAGYGDVGHLEFLARLTHTTEYATMLVTGPLRVVHLTTHYSLKEACSLVTRERIVAKLRLIQDTFRQWGIALPRIGVAALNPHAGEGGLFGLEEIEQIMPAIKEARESGINARGPLSADSVFIRAIGGEFDVVLETAVYLTEVANKYGDSWIENELRLANEDANPELYRIAFKMATGSGKTVVMAMLITWHVLNKRANPQDARFSDAFLIVTPGITIRDRLRVLLPNDPQNYYEQRDILPKEWMEDLGNAKIIITNFHAFDLPPENSYIMT